MKKILFVMPSLGSGGAEKALLTLLDLFDYEKYSVDLLLFRNEGLFADCVNPQVNVFEGGESYAVFDGSLSSALKYFAKKADFATVADRISYKLALKKNDRAKVWQLLSKQLPPTETEYDAAVGFLEGNAIYYCIDKVKAKTKIGYIHNDYSKLGTSAEFDLPFFEKLDYLVTVSAECAAVLNETFPTLNGKIREVHNIVSKKTVEKLSAGYPDEYAFNGVKLLTVGRLNEQKNYELAVETARLLRERGLKFKWFAIGKGEERENIERLIAENFLENEFILLGERANPYPYVKNCDVYVQTSRFEGKSIAVDEAKCLAKPIVVTCFSTVFDQISDGENGMIAEMKPESVAEKVFTVLGDENIRNSLVSSLSNQVLGNEQDIEKVYDMIGR